MEWNYYDYKFENGKGIFFTSDPHMGHKNIIKYCQRPFSDTNEMDEKIIENWNNTVKEDDIVFILGDIGMARTDSKSRFEDLINKIKRLNGRKILVPGNHDRHALMSEGFRDLFEDIRYQLFIKVEDKEIYLNHFPFTCFDGSYKGEGATWQLFGHVHSFPGSLGLDIERLDKLFPTQYDVGMDNNNYTPVSFEQVKEIINNQQQSLNLIRKC